MNPLEISGWNHPVPLCSLKMASKSDGDASKGIPDEYMTESLLAVINFDQHVARRKSRIEGTQQRSANDAYYVDMSEGGDIYFIEFKSGKQIDKLKEKMEGSMKICLELGIIPDEETMRTSVHYIVVYEVAKHENERQRATIEELLAKSVFAPSDFVAQKTSRQILTLFNVQDFEGVYCRVAESMTREEFKSRFVAPMEGKDRWRVPFPNGVPYEVELPSSPE